MPDNHPPWDQVPGVIGVGTDLLETRRMDRVWQRHGERFAQRILTAPEQALWQQRKQSLNFLAKQFAAKEALAKALGTGIAAGVGFQEMCVLRDERGCPYVRFQGRAAERLASLGGQQGLISLSDDAGFVLAFALITR